MAVAGAVVMALQGCVTADQAEDSSAQALAQVATSGSVDDGVILTSSLAVEARESMVDVLRRAGVADYDPALGELAWDGAEVTTIEDRGDVVIVPILHPTAVRALVALVGTGPDGATFQTAVLELPGDGTAAGETGEAIVLDVDGAVRIFDDARAATLGCWGRCMQQGGYACSTSCGGVPQCTAACMALLAAACGLHCLWPW